MSEGYNIKIGVDSRSGERGVKVFTASLNDSLRALREFDSKAKTTFAALNQFSKINASGLTKSVGQVTSAVNQLNKVRVSTKLISNLQSVSNALRGFRFSGADSLKKLPDALRALDSIRFNPSIVKGLNELKGAMKGFSAPPKSMDAWPKALSGFSKITIPTGLAKNLDTLKGSLKGFSNPPKGMAAWAKVLTPFASISIPSGLSKQLESLKLAMRGFTGPTKSALALPKFLAQLAAQKITPSLASNLAAIKAATSGLSGPGAKAGANLASLLTAMRGANPAQIAQVAAALQRLNGLSINIGRTLGSIGRGGTQSLGPFLRSIQQTNKAMQMLHQHSQGVSTVLSMLQGAVGGLSLVGFAKSVYETGVAWQSLTRTLSSVASSSDEVKQQLQFINDLTSRMPISLEAAASSYRKFAVAARLSGLSVKETQDVFENFSTGFSAMGLSADSQKYAFIALEQILSKGQVQMEELKSQLGDHLPGAVQILAQSMNVPVAKLMKLIEAGKVGSAEIVKMGKVVKEQFGGAAAAAVNSTQGQFVALENAWTRFKKTVFDNNFDSALGAMAKSLGEILNADQAQRFAADIGSAFQRAFKAISVLAAFMAQNKDIVLAFFKAFAAYSAIVAATSVLRMFSTPLLLLLPLFALVTSGSEKMNTALGAIAAGAALVGIAKITQAIGLLSSRVLLLVGAVAAAAAALDLLFNDGEILKGISNGVADVMKSVGASFSAFNGDVGKSLSGVFEGALKSADEFDKKQQAIANNNADSTAQYEKNAQREADLERQKLMTLSQEAQKLWDKLNPIGEANKKYADQIKLLDEIAAKNGLSPEQKNGAKRVLQQQKLDDINPVGAQVQDMQLALADAKALTAAQRATNDAKRFELDMLKKGVALNKEQVQVAEDYYKAIAKMNGELGNGFERWTATVGDFNDNLQESIKDGLGDLSSELASFVTGADADFGKLAQSIAQRFAKIAIDGIFDDVFTSMGLNGKKNGEKEASAALDKLGNIGETIQTQMTNIYTNDLAINGQKLSDLRGPLNLDGSSPTATENLTKDMELRGPLANGADKAISTKALTYAADQKKIFEDVASGKDRNVKLSDDAWDWKMAETARETAAAGLPVPAELQKYLKPQLLETSPLRGGIDPMTTGAINPALGGTQQFAKTLSLSNQDVVDLKKTLSTEWVSGAGESQGKGIIDTILNRQASGHWGTSIADVVNAKSQFSDINGRPAWNNGRNSVDDLPMSRITPQSDALVNKYLAERAAGAPSIVGDNLNYANPNYSDAKNLPWINALEGPTFGAGNAIHKHGTVPSLQGYRPGAFGIQYPGGPIPPETVPPGLDMTTTGSIPQKLDPAAAASLTQLNAQLQSTGAAAQQAQAPMQQMNASLQQTGTQAVTTAQQNQQASQTKVMASQQEATSVQMAASGMQSASVNAQMAGPAFMQAGTQMQQAGQAAQTAGQVAATANPNLQSFGGGITQLLGPLASAIPGLGQFGGAIMGLLGELGKGGGGGGVGSLFAGLFKEGGYSTSPVSGTRLSPSAWSNAPHYEEGTSNTSGGMPAVLHPNEAVIPLSRGRKIPVDLGGDNLAQKRASGQDSLDRKGRPAIVLNLNGVKDADSFKRSKGQITSALASASQRAQMRDN